MVYLKSVVAGTVAVAIAAALSPIVMGIYFLVVYSPGATEAIAWDPTSFARQPFIGDLVSFLNAPARPK